MRVRRVRVRVPDWCRREVEDRVDLAFFFFFFFLVELSVVAFEVSSWPVVEFVVVKFDAPRYLVAPDAAGDANSATASAALPMPTAPASRRIHSLRDIEVVLCTQ